MTDPVPHTPDPHVTHPALAPDQCDVCAWLARRWCDVHRQLLTLAAVRGDKFTGEADLLAAARRFTFPAADPPERQEP